MRNYCEFGIKYDLVYAIYSTVIQHSAFPAVHALKLAVSMVSGQHTT